MFRLVQHYLRSVFSKNAGRACFSSRSGVSQVGSRKWIITGIQGVLPASEDRITRQRAMQSPLLCVQ